MSTNMPVIDRFLSYVRLDASGCWLWIGGTSWNGYGRFKVDYKSIRAHRFSYAYFIGDIQANEVIRHKCNNPACVNPLHIVKGSIQDNVDDREAQHRGAKGSQVGTAKLTEEQIPKIRSLLGMGMSIADVAELYNVGRTTISYIGLNKTWKHV